MLNPNQSSFPTRVWCNRITIIRKYVEKFGSLILHSLHQGGLRAMDGKSALRMKCKEGEHLPPSMSYVIACA